MMGRREGALLLSEEQTQGNERLHFIFYSFNPLFTVI